MQLELILFDLNLFIGVCLNVCSVPAQLAQKSFLI